jgi:hypothetical protein
MSSSLFPVKREPKVRSLYDTIKNYKHSHAPQEFQRPESWGRDDRKKYFKSLLMNRLEGNLVFVDIQLCLLKVYKLAPTDRAGAFLEELSKKYDYIILDGNNRFKFLTALMNDEYQIPRGTYEYVIEDDISTIVIGPENNVFSKLPDLIQKVIRNRQVVISEYTQIDYSGLAETFLHVNAGVPLNNQEKRNAMDSPWAIWVRQIRKKIPSLLITIFDSGYIKRLKGDEWIVQSLDFALNCSSKKIKGIGQKSMNSLYNSDITKIDQQSYLENFIKLSKYITKMITDEDLTFENETNKEKVLSRGSTVTNLFWMMNNGVETYEEACVAVIAHQKSYKDSSIVNDDGNNYVWACNGHGVKNNEMKMNILPQIVEQVTGVTV